MGQTPARTANRGIGRLLGDIDPAVFAERWAERRPFVFRCDPAFHQALMNDVGTIGSRTDDASSVFRIGDAEAASGLSFATGDEATAAFATGDRTVVAQDVDKTVSWLGAWFCEFLEDTSLPVSQAKANVFFSPPGSGLARHFDNHEVVIIGLAGEKRFRIAPNQVIANPANNDDRCEDPMGALRTERNAASLPEEQEVLIGAGDAVYIPRGWWHATEAQAATSSVTFGFWSATTSNVCGELNVDEQLGRVPLVPDLGTGIQQRSLEETLALGTIDVPNAATQLAKLGLASLFRYQAALT